MQVDQKPVVINIFHDTFSRHVLLLTILWRKNIQIESRKSQSFLTRATRDLVSGNHFLPRDSRQYFQDDLDDLDDLAPEWDRVESGKFMILRKIKL